MKQVLFARLSFVVRQSPPTFHSNYNLILSPIDKMAPADETYALITQNLEEVLGGDIIKDVLAGGKAPVKGFWGAPIRSLSTDGQRKAYEE
jgi:hypothetical protein